MLLFLGRRKILYVTRVRAINKTVINLSRDAKFCVSQANMSQTDGKQNMPIIMIFLASHKQPCRKPMRYNISHLIMLLFLGRRKILRLYKAHAITIKGDMEPDDAP